MSLKDLYTKLESLDNGAQLVAEIKKEVATLSAEAKNHREQKEEAEAKLQSMQAELDEVKNNSTSKQTKLATLEAQINSLTKKYEEAEQARQAEETQKKPPFLATLNFHMVTHRGLEPRTC